VMAFATSTPGFLPLHQQAARHDFTSDNLPSRKLF
jgi:hypothetical protein